MSSAITLVSHALCPYVQRIAIALAEKGVPHDRVTVDLARKPGWFLALSPLGRTPVLRVGQAALFESAATLERKAAALHARFRVMEGQLGPGPWFAAEEFSLVDAAFAPVFRYFDTFDRIGDFGAFDGLTWMLAWRRELADRPSVRNAVAPDYADRLADFLRRKDSALSRLMPPSGPALRHSA